MHGQYEEITGKEEKKKNPTAFSKCNSFIDACKLSKNA
jgi:hypothetical protein